MEVPEPREQAFVGDFLGIEDHLDNLGVAGGFVANLLVGGIVDVAAHVAGGHAQYAVELAVAAFSSTGYRLGFHRDRAAPGIELAGVLAKNDVVCWVQGLGIAGRERGLHQQQGQGKAASHLA